MNLPALLFRKPTPPPPPPPPEPPPPAPGSVEDLEARAARLEAEAASAREALRQERERQAAEAAEAERAEKQRILDEAAARLGVITEAVELRRQRAAAAHQRARVAVVELAVALGERWRAEEEAAFLNRCAMTTLGQRAAPDLEDRPLPSVETLKKVLRKMLDVPENGQFIPFDGGSVVIPVYTGKDRHAPREERLVRLLRDRE